jgi:hypothetical protein
MSGGMLEGAGYRESGRTRIIPIAVVLVMRICFGSDRAELNPEVEARPSLRGPFYLN